MNNEKEINELVNNVKQASKNSKKLQDALDALRMSIKYLLFDLEATRREQETLQKMLQTGM